MDSSLLKQFSSFLHREKTRFNQRVVIFLFFLGVSTLLWYLSRLNSDYTTEVEYPISLVNIPREKVIVGTPPKSITLRVSGFGYSLLRFKIAAPLSPIVINLNQTQLMQLPAPHTRSFVLTSRVRNIIASQLSSDIQLIGIKPDTLFIEFTDLVSKRVKVLPNFRYTLARQHMLSGSILVEPDSISISGPASILDTITQMRTQLLVAEGIDNTSSFSLNLQPINQIGFSHRKVNLTIPVEKFTEFELEVPVNVTNLKNGSKVILLPPVVKLQCYAPIGRFDGIKPAGFNVFIDINDFDAQSGNNRVRVQIGSHPDFIRVVDFNPKFVEFYFEKR